jgi:probable rRNA maturation factor
LLAALACQSCDLSVLIVDDARMQRLNARYRGIDRPTDVLAFAMREAPFAHLHPQVLGDVVISAETALRQARARQHSLAEELTHLLIHGTLHLLGYDHEVSPADARLMRAKERELWRLAEPLVNTPLERQPSRSSR